MKRKILNIILTATFIVTILAVPAAANFETSDDIPMTDNSSLDTVNFTTADALNILRHTVGVGTLTSAQQSAYDMNSDGKVDTADALTILRIVVGLSATTVTPPLANNSVFTRYDYSDLTLENLRVTTIPDIGRLYLYDVVFKVNAPNVSYVYASNTTGGTLDKNAYAQRGISHIKSSVQVAENAKYNNTGKIINFQADPRDAEQTFELTVILYDSNINPIGHVILNITIPEAQSGLWQWE